MGVLGILVRSNQQSMCPSQPAIRKTQDWLLPLTLDEVGPLLSGQWVVPRRRLCLWLLFRELQTTLHPDPSGLTLLPTALWFGTEQLRVRKGENFFKLNLGCQEEVKCQPRLPSYPHKTGYRSPQVPCPSPIPSGRLGVRPSPLTFQPAAPDH